MIQRIKGYNRIILFLIYVITGLAILLILAGGRSITVQRLSSKGLAVMNSWNGMERIKNDFLINRSNIDISGDFDYKENVAAWKSHTEEFQLIFQSFIQEINTSSYLRRHFSDIGSVVELWDSTRTGISRVQGDLAQLERLGLDRLLLPQLINNYHIFRDSERIDFQDTVLVMNLINQFAFLDIMSKEFTGTTEDYILKLQSSSQAQIVQLSILAIVLLVLVFLVLILTLLSNRHSLSLNGLAERYRREEDIRLLRGFITGRERKDELIARIDPEEYPLVTGNPVIPVLLRINRFAEITRKYGLAELRTRITGFSDELQNAFSSQNMNCVNVPIEEGLVVYHILAGTLLAETVRQRTDKLLTFIRNYVHSGDPFSFSITYGNVHIFPDDAQEYFQELIEASYYRILYGYDKTISAEELRNRKKIDSQYPLRTEKTLVECLKQGKIDEAKVAYSEILKELVESSYSTLKNGVYRLTVVITSAVDTLEKFNNISDHIDINSFSQSLFQMETLDEIDSALSGLIDRVAGELVHKRDTHVYHQVSQSNRYNSAGIF